MTRILLVPNYSLSSLKENIEQVSYFSFLEKLLELMKVKRDDIFWYVLVPKVSLKEKIFYSDIKKKLGSSSFGATRKKGLFLLRYLGSSVEECKNGFNAARDALHQSEALMFGCHGVRPRIWNY